MLVVELAAGRRVVGEQPAHHVQLQQPAESKPSDRGRGAGQQAELFQSTERQPVADERVKISSVDASLFMCNYLMFIFQYFFCISEVVFTGCKLLF